MATYNTLTGLLSAIANAIRSKTKETGVINAQDFPTEISSIVLGSGNATVGDVLKDKTFSNDNGPQTGTMPNNGAVSQSLSFGGSYTIPVGYHNGSGKVTAQSPSGSISITSNGSHNVSNYATANVNVKKYAKFLNSDEKTVQNDGNVSLHVTGLTVGTNCMLVAGGGIDSLDGGSNVTVTANSGFTINSLTKHVTSSYANVYVYDVTITATTATLTIYKNHWGSVFAIFIGAN